MQIGGLGFFQSQYPSVKKESLSGEVNSGFASLVSNLIGNSETGVECLDGVPGEECESVEELIALVEFLQINDLSQLENGQELFDKAVLQTNTDIPEVIAEQLKLSKEVLKHKLEGLRESINPDVKIENLSSDLSVNANEVNSIQALIQTISMLQIKESTTLHGIDIQAFKALKLFDLLTAKQDFIGNKIDLKAFLGIVQEKLDGHLKNSLVFGQKENIIQKVFAPLADDLNIFKQKKLAGTELLTEAAPKMIGRFDAGLQGQIQLQALSKPEQLVLMNQQGRPLSADHLMEQFESILSKSSFLKTGGAQKLFIKLNPDHLGAIRVELIHKDSGIIAKILTSTASAKEILDSQINGLKQAFSSQNLQVERIEISQQMTQQDRAFNKEPQQQGQGQRQHKEDNKQKPDSDFNNSLKEALLDAEV